MSHVVLHNGEERAMPTAKQACKFIRDIVAILVELRALAAELAFTAAAIYGVCQEFRVLSRWRSFVMVRKRKGLPGKIGIPGTTTYIRVVRLGKWFPPGDPLAAAIARLSILREDFMLELRGIYANSITALDTHSDAWRRTYFFRSSVRTLWEIQGTLTTIRMNPEFKRILQKRSAKEQNQLQQISSKLNAAASLTRDIRNAMGGHVLPEAVTRALDHMSSDRWGVLEFGSVIGATHFKIAGELIVEMLVADIPENKKLAKLEADMKTMASLLPVIQSLELVLAMYADARGLI
jgi:hypothetical protein